ncbi:ABC transporter ATP-binding protein [Microlunatus speluncae]|uniref:ABC transporter ATP-binding protein n=1 Tax=Microlunatus speluncae TaxID=2594267 RepID=UPI001C2D71B7|nr:ABC transporter ATP-binding protein [Microlunatus speluncae]
MITMAVLHALLGLGQGLLLALLVPILGAVLRPEPDLAAAVPWLAVGAVGVIIFCWLCDRATTVGFVASGESASQLRHALMGHLTTLPFGWFTAANKGRFARTATSVAGGAARVTVVVGGPAVLCLSVAITVTVLLLIMDWRLGLVLAVTLPVALLVLRRARRVTEVVVADIEQAGTEITSRAIEFGQAQPVLRAAGQGPTGTQRMRHDLDDHRVRYARGLNRLLGPDLGYTAVITAGLLLILVLVAVFLVDGTIDLPIAVAALVLAIRFLEPMGSLSGHVSGIGAIDHLIKTMEEFLATPSLPRADAPRAPGDRAEIEFDRVGFRYPGTEVAALADVSFRCAPGSSTALVGPSGSGKTTVTRLIARFFDASSGSVRVGGRDVRDLDPTALLDRIAIVFQDVYLFDTTIEDNVRMAWPEAGPAELERAARQARLDEVIDRLPDGWATRVGEGGAQLSGGERQRVSIARAFLKPAAIVLIDEAASALDPENEAAIGAAIGELSRDPERTVIVIAHRPATLEAADQVICLDGGRIVEQGTPAELALTGGSYARLFRQYEESRTWRIRGGAA